MEKPQGGWCGLKHPAWGHAYIKSLCHPSGEAVDRESRANARGKLAELRSPPWVGNIQRCEKVRSHQQGVQHDQGQGHRTCQSFKVRR